MLAALLGLLTVAAGAIVVAWSLGLVPQWSSTLDLSRFSGSVVDTEWWPWMSAGVGVLLALLALVWLLRRAQPVPRPPALSRASTDAGAVRVDLDAVAQAVARRLEAGAPISSARGKGVDSRGVFLVDVRASIDEISDGPAIIRAVERAQQELDDSFGEGRAVCQLVVSAPGRWRSIVRRGSATPRVH
ncbi:hypothetical protein BHE97_13045 [Aeromicrobium sp. PE09-221]|nr:hypothetical protein BHE97_13045 [Aeromicrobium sp. PE09-221]